MDSRVYYLICGLAMRKQELSFVQSLMKEQGVNVVVEDNLCVGEGPRMERALSISDQAQYHRSRIQALVSNGKMVTVFGISMGGMIAIELASQCSTGIDHVILGATTMNSTSNPTLSKEVLAKWRSAKTPEDLSNTIQIVFGKTTRENNPEIMKRYLEYRIRAENQQSPKDFIMQLESVMSFQGVQAYQNIFDRNEVKVSLITGDEDELFDLRHTTEIKKCLALIGHIELKKTGHMMHLENPHGLAQAILSLSGR